MQGTWYELIQDAVILDDCKKASGGKSGRLFGSESGIAFESPRGSTLYEWKSISRISASKEIWRKEGVKFRVTLRMTSDSLREDRAFAPIQFFEKWDATAEEKSVLNRIAEHDSECSKQQEQSSSLSFYFESAGYLGGLSEMPTAKRGSVQLNLDGVFIDQRLVVPWNQVDGILVESEQVAKSKSKVAATMIFGVLGAAGAKGSKSQSVLSIRRKDGEIAYFVIDNIGAQMIKAKISPLLNALKMPILGDALQSVPNSGGLAAEFERLASLRTSGLLTEEEFAKAKGKLLE